MQENASTGSLVRVFRHRRCEGPGYLAELLERHRVPYEMVCIDEGVSVPMDLDGIGGLVLMGSAGSVNDPRQWISEELELIRRALDQDVPLMGVCFGGQLISRAMGGEVARGPRGMEIGWHPVERVEGCDCRGWLDGLPSEITSFHWHAEVFTVPDGAVPLLRSPSLYNQAFCLGRHLAMQFHLEMTAEMIQGWIRAYGGDLRSPSPYVQSEEQLTAALDARLAGLHATADQIYGAWLRRAGLLG